MGSLTVNWSRMFESLKGQAQFVIVQVIIFIFFIFNNSIIETTDSLFNSETLTSRLAWYMITNHGNINNSPPCQHWKHT